MSRIALWGYTALFAFIGSLYVARGGGEDPFWAFTLNAAVLLAAAVGLLGYALRIRNPAMISVWRRVAPLVAAGFLAIFILDYPSAVASDPNRSDAENAGAVFVALLFGVFFPLPAIAVNFRFAQARHLEAAPRREPLTRKRIALWIYIALLGLVALTSLASALNRYPGLADTLDVVTHVAATIGLLGYALRARSPALLAAWKVAAPLIPVGFLVWAIRTWPGLIAPAPGQSALERFLLIAGTLAFPLPAIIVNFRFAQGRHLRDRPGPAA